MVECQIMVCEIASTVGIPTERVHKILHKQLKLNRLLVRWVFHSLLTDQKLMQKEISMECLAMVNCTRQDFLH